MEHSPFGIPALELDGNRKIVISGRCVITVYSPEEMRIRCGKLEIGITGDGLELETLDSNELSICGTISGVGFVTEG
ncbi:MAG: YabP/YqfC family sporulation protein [Butyricicoccus sp.]